MDISWSDPGDVTKSNVANTVNCGALEYKVYN